jgi:phosphatidylserine/phosphatidylglycerophosphate/cardiolipin synthase-like enzyme
MKYFLALLCLLSITAFGEVPDAPDTVCFTPQMNCTNLIIDLINNAKQTIYVHAYAFTSEGIEQALVDAVARKVTVNILLDKIDIDPARFFYSKGIETWVDYKPNIAHNKIMILDGQKVITGSFNFTKAAQISNAENVVFITNTHIASLYFNNWKYRFNQSISSTTYFGFKNVKQM